MGAMFSALAGCGDRVLTSIGDASPTADVAEMSDASLADGTRDAARRDADPPADAADRDAPSDVSAVDAPIVDVSAVDAPDAPPSSAPPAWTWTPVADTRCGNGSTAGYGLRAQPGSRSLMIFMMGGGACWDGPTCFGPALLRAAHVDDRGPYDEGAFRRDLASYEAFGLTDQSDGDNPFRASTMVFIPYCTGDVHAGDRVATYDVLLSAPRTVYHHGARNMAAFLTSIAARAPGVERVWLVGASAGGYGAQFNAPRVQAAFPSARVDVLADGAPMITPWGGQRDRLAAAWALRFPSDCPGCGTRWEEYIPWLASHLAPPRRTALITYAQDPTIGAYFGYPLANTTSAISWMLTHDYPRAPRSGFFVVPGAGHVAINRYRTATGVGGASLRSWVRAWATDDREWGNVGP